MIALLDSTLGDAVIYGGGGGGGGQGESDSTVPGDGNLFSFGGIVFPSDEFQFWAG